MSPRPRSSTPIADLIADAVRSALAAQGVTPAARRVLTPAASIAVAAPSAAAASDAPAGSPPAAAPGGAAPAREAPAATAATPAASHAPSAAALARAAQNELLDRVRAD